jgi:transposase-like protein
MKASEPNPQSAGVVRRRQYDEEFKKEVVALITGGRCLTDLARELGISHWNLRDWKVRYGAGAASAGRPGRSAGPSRGGEASAAAMAAELIDLRRELEAVRRQRDILKKALAIVGQEPLSATR